MLYSRDLVRGQQPCRLKYLRTKSCRLFEDLRNTTAAPAGSMQLRLVLPLRFRLPQSKIDFLQGLEPGTTESAQGTVFFRLLKFVRLACSCTFSILRGRIIPFIIPRALPATQI